MEYSLLQICAMFFVYAFLGWCSEVAFAAVCTGKFVNRGFLNGPVCPIYGFGLVLVVLCLTPVQHNTPALFCGAVVLTSVLEYITGFALEKVFHSRWWDYSDMPFNIGGYVCLKFSLLWGFACLLVMKMLHPTVMLLIALVPVLLLRILTAMAAAGMAVDLTVTVLGIRRMQARLRLLTRLAQELHELSDDVGEKISDNVLIAMDKFEGAKDKLEDMRDGLEEKRTELEELRQRTSDTAQRKREELRALLQDKKLTDSRLVRAFPNLKSAFGQERFEKLLERRKK